MPEEFIENKLKGIVVETIVEEMFKKLGFYVLKIGQEYSVNPLIQIKQFVKECQGKFDFKIGEEFHELSFLKRLPDFILIHKGGDVKFLEVRYRHNAEVRDDIFETFQNYPDCILLVANSSVGETIAKSNYGEVTLDLDNKRREDLKRTRFHIWICTEQKKSEIVNEKILRFSTITLTLEEWLKGEFNIENNSLIKKYGGLIGTWLGKNEI